MRMAGVAIASVAVAAAGMFRVADIMVVIGADIGADMAGLAVATMRVDPVVVLDLVFGLAAVLDRVVVHGLVVMLGPVAVAVDLVAGIANRLLVR
jgi:hypothetical protein